ncbi:MAG: adenylate kinase [Firmicutes bacterium]|nr:adenylate kinase [Bacillota bacterium]
MNIVLLGAPGSGKGTQAQKIKEFLKIPHISTGDTFRQNIKENTELGKAAKAFVDKGELVPDEIVVKIVQNRIKEKDCDNGYLLDGFPRTFNQAEELFKVTKIDNVINLDIDSNLLLKRLTGRRTCRECQESYHIDSIKNRDNCVKCNGILIIREDDKEETVKSRLKVYESSTKPLIEYYTQKRILLNICANRTIDEVFNDIKKCLEHKA